MTPIDQKFAGAIAAEYFGVVASVRVLPGEFDKNFLLTTDAGEGYILKFSHLQTTNSQIDFENAMLAHLAGSSLHDLLPGLVPTKAAAARALASLVNVDPFEVSAQIKDVLAY